MVFLHSEGRRRSESKRFRDKKRLARRWSAVVQTDWFPLREHALPLLDAGWDFPLITPCLHLHLVQGTLGSLWELTACTGAPARRIHWLLWAASALWTPTPPVSWCMCTHWLQSQLQSGLPLQSQRRLKCHSVLCFRKQGFSQCQKRTTLQLDSQRMSNMPPALHLSYQWLRCVQWLRSVHLKLRLWFPNPQLGPDLRRKTSVLGELWGLLKKVLS